MRLPRNRCVLFLAIALGVSSLAAAEFELPLVLPRLDVLQTSFETDRGEIVEVDLQLALDQRGKLVCGGDCRVGGAEVLVKGKLTAKAGVVSYSLALKGVGEKLKAKIAGIIGAGATTVSIKYSGAAGRAKLAGHPVTLTASVVVAGVSLSASRDGKGKITGTGVITSGIHGGIEAGGPLKGKLRGDALSWSLKAGRWKLSFRGERAAEVFRGTLKIKIPPEKAVVFDFPSPDPTAADGPSFGSPPVTPVLDTDRAASGILGPGGGELVTTGADGTVYRFDVPTAALEGDVEITLTPVTEIQGLPLEGGLVAAVELEPAGLAFDPPATLVLELPGGVDANVAGFAWTGPGNTFSISPWWLDADAGTASLEVSHFSGYGLAIPGPTQLAALAAELLAVQGADNEIAVELAACDIESCIRAALEQWFDSIVKPRLDAGAESVVATLAGHEALRNWESVLTGAAAAAVFITPLGTILPPGLNVRLEEGREQNLDNLRVQWERYTQSDTLSDCEGTVVDWKDWIRIPDELYSRASETYAEDELMFLSSMIQPLGEGLACVTLEIVDVEFPQTLDPDDPELELSFRTVVALPGASPVGVRSHVTLDYTDGASGPAELTTEPDGTLSLTVEWSPESGVDQVVVAIEAVEVALERPALLTATHTANTLGAVGKVFFNENGTPGPRPIIPIGGDSAVRAFVFADPGELVTFTIDGPGTINGGADAVTVTSEPTVDSVFPDASVTYTAPAGAVARGIVARITATATIDGETHSDTLTVYPHWVELSLEADLGDGFIVATSSSLLVNGNGPFNVRAHLTEAGATVADPPQPLSAALKIKTAAETLSAEGLTCCLDALSDSTEASGYLDFTWQGHGIEADQHSIVASYESLDSQNNVASVIEVSMTLRRELQNLDVSINLPSQAEPGVPFAVEIFIEDEDTEDPAVGLLLELIPIGGSVTSNVGMTDEEGSFATTAEIDPQSLGFGVRVVVSSTADGSIITEASAFTIRADLAGTWVGRSRVIKQTCTGIDASTSEATAAFAILSAQSDGIVVYTHYRYGAGAWALETFQVEPSGDQLLGSITRTGVRRDNNSVQTSVVANGTERPLEGGLEAGLLTLRTSSGHEGGPWCQYLDYELRHESESPPVDLAGTWSFFGNLAESGFETIDMTVAGAFISGTLTHVNGQTPVHGRIWGNRIVGIWSERKLPEFPGSHSFWGVLENDGTVIANLAAIPILVR